MYLFVATSLLHFTSLSSVLKSFHWQKSPEHIHFKVLSSTYNSQPKCMYIRELFTIQLPDLPDHLPVSPFLDPPSLPISCSPNKPYPSLHHVFRMTYHLNYAPFHYLHHHHCQSQDIIFIRPLFITPGPSTKKLNCNIFKNSYPDHPPSQSKQQLP